VKGFYWKYLLAIYLLVARLSATAQTARYNLTDIGSLGGSSGIIRFICDTGVAAGTSTDTNGNSLAFAWYNGSFTNIGSVIGTAYPSDCIGVNSHNKVGVTANKGGGITNTYMYDLSASASQNTVGACLTENDEIFGMDSSNQPFRWKNSQLLELWQLGITTAFSPSAANKLGDIAGNNAYFHTSTGGDGSYPSPPGFYLNPYSSISTCGMNMLGDVIGQFSYSPYNYGYLYKVAKPNDVTGVGVALPLLGSATYARTYCINDQRQIGGTSGGRAVLWTISAKSIEIEDLNNLIPAGSGYTLTQANSINNLGWIGCRATYGSQTSYMVILKPN